MDPVNNATTISSSTSSFSSFTSIEIVLLLDSVLFVLSLALLMVIRHYSITRPPADMNSNLWQRLWRRFHTYTHELDLRHPIRWLLDSTLTDDALVLERCGHDGFLYLRCVDRRA